MLHNSSHICADDCICLELCCHVMDLAKDPLDKGWNGTSNVVDRQEQAMNQSDYISV